MASKMNDPLKYRQLEIWWVDLEPTRGSETRKKRPCVILQSDTFNRASQTLLVAPLLPGHRKWLSCVNVLPTKQNGLDKERNIQLKQIRVVDISRVSKKQGILEKPYFPAITQALQDIFGLDEDE